MGDDWDDDDWEADDVVEKAMASKAKKEVRSEDEAEDSEEERLAEEERRRAAAPKPKPKPKAAPVEYYVPLSDKKAEKERLKKLQEEADARLAADLFAGVDDTQEKKDKKAAEEKAAESKPGETKVKLVIVDAFDKVELNTQGDVDRMLTQVFEKFEKAKAKQAHHFFLTNLLKQLEPELTFQELDLVTKSLAQLQKEKQVEKTTATAEKKKGNEKLDKHTKFNRHDEMDVVYGGTGGDWEDWEDWEDWQE
eukprot:TRINITY_DN4242_c0_g1_i1.p2 TRINITY_DN4242_c0_g1~~TRINITY_DN4242_c0_g1_i1.p2  ORF type:complete len:251 (+),score=143.27 TRINITY_DN4242_c0_g1_i1:138-890(+)